MGISRAATSIPSSIGRLEGGFEGPIVGWLADKYGPRRLIIIGTITVSSALILMNFINAVWAFYVVWGVILGTGFNLATTLPIHKAISNWFVKKRGLAISIMMVFSGLSGVIVMPLIALLLTTQSWRTTCLIGGLVIGLLGLPLAWFGFKDQRPEYYGLLPDGAVTDDAVDDRDQMIDKGIGYAANLRELEFTLKQALKTPAYWLVTISFAIHTLVAPALSIHTIPFLTDRGIDPLNAAGMMAIMIGSSLPARLAGGIIADRLNINNLPYLVGGAYLMQALGIAVFLLNQQSIAMIYLWFILYGTGMGVSFTINTIVIARYFGRKAFGSIQGSARIISAPTGVLAPIYAGWVYDSTGSYIPAYTVFAVLLAVAFVLMLFARPPKPPAQISDIYTII